MTKLIVVLVLAVSLIILGQPSHAIEFSGHLIQRGHVNHYNFNAARQQKVCRVRPSDPVEPSISSESHYSEPTQKNEQPAPSPETPSQQDNNNNNPAPTTKTEAPPAPAPTTTTKQPVAPAPVYNSPAPVYGNKKGVGINNPSWASNRPLSGTMGWLYTWSPWCSKSIFDLGIECVPMLWGWKQVGDFQKNLLSYKGLGVKNLLFVNEPDQHGQSHLSPEDAASLWWQQFAPLKGQFGLVGPALTSSPGCIEWQKQFMARVASTPPDYMALHWYGGRASDMIAYLEEFHANFPNYKLWITEFACHSFGGPPCEGVPAFMGKIIPYLNSKDWIARYSWFGYLINMSGVDSRNQLINPNGQTFSDLGWQYANS